MLTLLDKAMSDCCLPLYAIKVSEENSQIMPLLQHVLDQVGLSFLACFNALHELCRSIYGRTKKPEIIYQLVMFFKKSLLLLHTVFKQQAESEAIHRHLREKSARQDVREYTVNKCLVKIIISILFAIAWDVHQPGHSEILEGVLFCILDHVGRLVSEATFGEHVSASDNPGNITKSAAGPQVNEVSKIQARYMVQILHAALGGSSRRELVAKVLAAGKTNENATPRNFPSSGPGLLASDLLSKPKLLLRSTMMQSAVGGLNQESLGLPSPPTEETILRDEEEENMEEYGADWLIETIWAMIGWDLIT